MARSTSLPEFETALRRLQMPMFTVMYADRDGHILHVFNGRVPVRPSGGWSDWEGAVPGESPATLWTRTHAYEELPRVLDPASGWLHERQRPTLEHHVPRSAPGGSLSRVHGSRLHGF